MGDFWKLMGSFWHLDERRPEGTYYSGPDGLSLYHDNDGTIFVEYEVENRHCIRGYGRTEQKAIEHWLKQAESEAEMMAFCTNCKRAFTSNLPLNKLYAAISVMQNRIRNRLIKSLGDALFFPVAARAIKECCKCDSIMEASRLSFEELQEAVDTARQVIAEWAIEQGQNNE